MSDPTSNPSINSNPGPAPETMHCLRIKEWDGNLEVAEVPVPDPGPTEVLIDVEATGVGRTVANVIAGNMNDDPRALPRIPGHEVVGTVAETSDGVTHLSEGDFVTVYFHLVCGHCRRCHEGLDSLCENHRGWVSAHTDGGFAEYACLPAENVLAISDGVEPVEATVIPDAVATPYHVANQRAQIDRGDDVMVLGAGGGVGIHMLQMAHYFGADVTAVDVIAEKLDACAEYGAVQTIDASKEDVVDVAGSEYDAVIDFTGDANMLDVVPSLLAPRGRLVHLTTFPDNTTTLSPRTAVSNEIEVVGSRYCTKHEILRAGSIVAEGVIEPVVSETVGWKGVPDLLDRVVANEVLGRGAMTPS